MPKDDLYVECALAGGASMQHYESNGVSILPLLGWYDYSFGQPDTELFGMWMDYHACRWPEGLDIPAVAAHFAGLNEFPPCAPGSLRISFSHFLPRIDVMPEHIPARHRMLLW